MPMTTTSDVLQMLAESDRCIVLDLTRFVLDLTSTPRLVMKDSQGNEICTVPKVHFDDLCSQSYLVRVGEEWRLTDAGKKAAAQ
jgi:hypothetical protein